VFPLASSTTSFHVSGYLNGDESERIRRVLYVQDIDIVSLLSSHRVLSFSSRKRLLPDKFSIHPISRETSDAPIRHFHTSSWIVILTEFTLRSTLYPFQPKSCSWFGSRSAYLKVHVQDMQGSSSYRDETSVLLSSPQYCGSYFLGSGVCSP